MHEVVPAPAELILCVLQVASAQAELRSQHQRSQRLETELEAEKQRYQALQLHHLRPRSPDRAAQAAWTAEQQQLSTQVGHIGMSVLLSVESKALQAAWSA